MTPPWRWSLIVIAVTIALILLTFGAWAAESQCAPRDIMFQRFASVFGEVPAITARIDSQSGPGELTITINPATHTWTAFASSGDQICMVASGGDWAPATENDDSQPQMFRLPGDERQYMIPIHYAQTGWAYSAICCSGRDCAEVDDAAITPTDDGWLVNATGEVIGYRDSRVHKSGDEFFHRCARLESPEKTVCLYVPQTWG